MDRHSDPADRTEGPVATEASNMRFPFAKTAVLIALVVLTAATPAFAARYGYRGGYRYRGGYYNGGSYGYRDGYYGYRGAYPYRGWGVGTGYVYPQIYVTPEGYVQAPGGVSQSFYPPTAALSTALVDAARVRIQCPSDAQIWFDGTTTTQTGGDRIYTSPRLQPGKQYEYQVKALWHENGKPVEQTRTITVAAGKTVDLNFTAPVTN
jgi:uncharacterized protein (TIGR03000 family)